MIYIDGKLVATETSSQKYAKFTGVTIVTEVGAVGEIGVDSLKAGFVKL